MKKLLKKRYFTPLLVVAIVAIGASVAYAWWTTTASSTGQSITTGTAALTVGGQLPITVTNLIPQDTLSGVGTTATPVAANDAVPAGYNVNFFYVSNTGNTPLGFEGWLDNGAGDAGVLASQVYVKITIAPTDSPWPVTGSLSSVGGPYMVYCGPIGALYGQAGGSTYLTTAGHDKLAAGQSAIYKVVTWLNGPTCDNSSQGKAMTCDLEFASL